MKIMIIRHAEPYYAIDGLTKKGHVEAELLSRRLVKVEKVSGIYVSPLGRAQATAAYTLEKLGRTAVTLPWLAEFRGRCPDPVTGKDRICWDFRPEHWSDHQQLLERASWIEDPLLKDSTVGPIWQETCAGVDAVLAQHGYVKDGPVYRCENNTDDVLMFFCHFGIGTAMMAHLIGIPPVPLWQGLCMQPSSVTTLVTQERVKGEVDFRCMQYGDISHLYAADERYSTAGLFPEVFNGRDSTDPPEWDGLYK